MDQFSKNIDHFIRTKVEWWSFTPINALVLRMPSRERLLQLKLWQPLLLMQLTCAVTVNGRCFFFIQSMVNFWTRQTVGFVCFKFLFQLLCYCRSSHIFLIATIEPELSLPIVVNPIKKTNVDFFMFCSFCRQLCI